MTNVAVVGAQWGDEGKGKIVDWLSERAEVVVRFQGGHNAGHTLVIGGRTFKLSLLPSGVVQGKLSIIGNGVEVDPWHLLKEIEGIRAQGIEPQPGEALLRCRQGDSETAWANLRVALAGEDRLGRMRLLRGAVEVAPLGPVPWRVEVSASPGRGAKRPAATRAWTATNVSAWKTRTRRGSQRTRSRWPRSARGTG